MAGPDTPDRPDDWGELSRRRREPATADPPAELADLLGPRESVRKEVRWIDRVTESEPVARVEGYRPPWIEASARPRRAKRSAPQRITHHGRDVDPLVIWHPESRSTYFDLAYPWGCVCKIITPSGRNGSGVLVGPRHVLTASHCVDWNTSDAETIEVHRNGTFVRATTTDILATAFTRVGPGGPSASQLDEDYAVLTLATRLGDAFGWFGSRTYDSGWDDDHLWTTIGYPGDFGGMVPTFEVPVSLDEDEFDLGSGRAMTTSADAMPGQSGSPMFGMWNGIADVVSVISAVGSIWFSGVENWCSGGSDLPRLITNARNANP